MLLNLVPFVALAAALPSRRWGPTPHSGCRFAPSYNLSSFQAQDQDSIDKFITDVMVWEGHFHSANVGYNPINSMTYDGTLLNQTTGLHDSNISVGLHQFSAASKESLQIMVYVHVLAGDWNAAAFISPDAPDKAQDMVADIMKLKLKTYLQFNETFPGFGGFLPWYANYANGSALTPTYDWVNRVPALDNGELIWAVYAAVDVMENSGRDDWMDLASGWQAWLDYTKETAKSVFYNGSGLVCTVIDLNQSVQINTPSWNRSCEGSVTSILNDPYEGELFTWWMYFFSKDLTDADREALWEVKRPQLKAIDYHGSLVNASTYTDGTPRNYSNSDPVLSKTIGPITVQEGFWFSAHEQWKLLEMPYLDIPLVYRVFENAERVRTCNSVLMEKNAGQFASVNNVTNVTTGEILGYVGLAGIPGICNQTLQEQDLITPYGIFPTMLFNQSVGLAWYHNMLLAKGMQNPYGSTESTRRDGSNISSFVSWDSKITTVNAILGGVGKYSGRKMKKDGVYDEFWRRTQYEYGLVFGDNGENLKGEDVDFCWPDYQVPDAGVMDYSQCMM